MKMIDKKGWAEKYNIDFKASIDKDFYYWDYK